MDMSHGSNNSTTNPCKMSMTFHARTCEMILWTSWEAYTVGTFIVSAIIIAIMAFSYEGIKFLREYLHMHAEKAQRAVFISTGNDPDCCLPKKRTVSEQIFNWSHTIEMILYAFQLFLAYILMLIFMLCNYYLCFAIILGAALGFFCFGWFRKGSNSMDCCH